MLRSPLLLAQLLVLVIEHPLCQSLDPEWLVCPRGQEPRVLCSGETCIVAVGHFRGPPALAQAHCQPREKTAQVLLRPEVGGVE